MSRRLRDVLAGLPWTVVLGVAVAYVAAALLGRTVAYAVGIAVPWPPGLVLALALLGGPVVAWGAALGHVVTDLVTGTFGPETGVGVLAEFLLAFAAVRLWGTFDPLSTDEPPGELSGRNAVEYAAVALTVAMLVGALTAWGAVVFGSAPFRAVVVDATRRTLLSVLTVGSVVLYLGPRLAPQVRRVLAERFDGVGTARFDPPAEPLGAGVDGPSGRSGKTGFVLLAVALGWVVAGFWIGLVFQAVEHHRRSVLINRFGRTAPDLLSLGGPGGVTALSLLGVVCLGVTTYVLFARATPDPE